MRSVSVTLVCMMRNAGLCIIILGLSAGINGHRVRRRLLNRLEDDILQGFFTLWHLARGEFNDHTIIILRLVGKCNLIHTTNDLSVLIKLITEAMILVTLIRTKLILEVLNATINHKSGFPLGHILPPDIIQIDNIREIVKSYSEFLMATEIQSATKFCTRNVFHYFFTL